MGLLTIILNWFTGNTLDRILKTVDNKIDNETTREEIRSDIVKKFAEEQSKIVRDRTWIFQLIFLIPAGFWFASVCIYSVLWCQQCVYPQSWVIAALPGNLTDWVAVMISALFVTNGITQVFKR